MRGPIYKMLEAKVGVGRADALRIGTESHENRVATGDAWRRAGEWRGQHPL
jgi:hypothetical protein